jgi:hypothetical protein
MYRLVSIQLQLERIEIAVSRAEVELAGKFNMSNVLLRI